MKKHFQRRWSAWCFRITYFQSAIVWFWYKRCINEAFEPCGVTHKVHHDPTRLMKLHELHCDSCLGWGKGEALLAAVFASQQPQVLIQLVSLREPFPDDCLRLLTCLPHHSFNIQPSAVYSLPAHVTLAAGRFRVIKAVKGTNLHGCKDVRMK